MKACFGANKKNRKTVAGKWMNETFGSLQR